MGGPWNLTKSLCRIDTIFGASEYHCHSSQVSEYSEYIQLTLEKKLFQIIFSVCFTMLTVPQGWHLWYQHSSHAGENVAQQK